MKTTYGNGMSSKIQGKTVGGNRRERERERGRNPEWHRKTDP